MGRAKVPMKTIACEKKRNRVFLNRRKGLAKKCMELSVLCGVDVCMISLSPPGKRRFEVETYPKDLEAVRRMVEEFRQRGEKERGKNRYTLAGMLREKMRRMEAELRDMATEDGGIRPPEPAILEGMSEEELREMAAGLDVKLDSVRREIEMLKCAMEIPATKTEPVVNQDWNYTAAADQITRQQILPCLPVNHPYDGGAVHDVMMVDLHQVQPLNVRTVAGGEWNYQEAVQCPYDYYEQRPVNCGDYSLPPLPPSDIGSSCNAFIGGTGTDWGEMAGGDSSSFQDGFSFGFPNYNGPKFF